MSITANQPDTKYDPTPTKQRTIVSIQLNIVLAGDCIVALVILFRNQSQKIVLLTILSNQDDIYSAIIYGKATAWIHSGHWNECGPVLCGHQPVGRTFTHCHLFYNPVIRLIFILLPMKGRRLSQRSKSACDCLHWLLMMSDLSATTSGGQTLFGVCVVLCLDGFDFSRRERVLAARQLYGWGRGRWVRSRYTRSGTWKRISHGSDETSISWIWGSDENLNCLFFLYVSLPWYTTLEFLEVVRFSV